MTLIYDASSNGVNPPNQPYQRRAESQCSKTSIELRPYSVPSRASLSQLTRRRTDREEPILGHAILPIDRSCESEHSPRRASSDNINAARRAAIGRQQAYSLNGRSQRASNKTFSFSDSSCSSASMRGYEQRAAAVDQLDQHLLNGHSTDTVFRAPARSAAPALRHSRRLLLQQVRRTFAEQQEKQELARRAAAKLFSRYDLHSQTVYDAYDENWDEFEQNHAPKKYLSRRDDPRQAHYSGRKLHAGQCDGIHRSWPSNCDRRSLRDFSNTQSVLTRLPNDHRMSIVSRKSCISYSHCRNHPNSSAQELRNRYASPNSEQYQNCKNDAPSLDDGENAETSQKSSNVPAATDDQNVDEKSYAKELRSSECRQGFVY